MKFSTPGKIKKRARRRPRKWIRDNTNRAIAHFDMNCIPNDVLMNYRTIDRADAAAKYRSLSYDA